MMNGAPTAGFWAVLVPHHPQGSCVELRADLVTIGSGPRPKMPNDQHHQHIEVTHDPYLSSLHFELRRKNGDVVHVTSRSANRSYLNGLQLEKGVARKVEADADNARVQLEGEAPDAPMLFAIVPNGRAARRLNYHAECFTGYTLRMQSAVVAPAAAAVLPVAAAHAPVVVPAGVPAGAPPPAAAPPPPPTAPPLAAAAPAAPPSTAPPPAAAVVPPARAASSSAAGAGSGGIFEGLRFCIPKVGENAGVKKHEILENAAKKHGAEVLPSSDVARATHVVLDENRTPQATPGINALESIPPAEWPLIHTQDWIGRCMKRNMVAHDELVHPECQRDARIRRTQTTPSEDQPSRSSISASQDAGGGAGGGAGSRRDARSGQGNTGKSSRGAEWPGGPQKQPKRLQLGRDGSAHDGGGDESDSDAGLPRVDTDDEEAGLRGLAPTRALTSVQEDEGHNGGGSASRLRVTGWRGDDGNDSDGAWSDDEDSVAVGPDVAAEQGITTCELMVKTFKRLAAFYRSGGAGSEGWAKNQHYGQVIPQIQTLTEPIYAAKLRALGDNHGEWPHTLADRDRPL